MEWSITPVKPAHNKRSSTGQYKRGRQGGSSDFARLLGELAAGTYAIPHPPKERQDGFTPGTSPPAAKPRSREIDILRYKIEQVNKIALSVFTQKGA